MKVFLSNRNPAYPLAVNHSMTPVSTMRLPYQGDNDAVLAALIADASVMPEYVALCLLTGVAHGYSFQNLALQLQNGRFLCQSWNDLSSQASEPAFVIRDMNLRDELQHLRTDGTFLRQHQRWIWTVREANYPDKLINRNPDLKTGRTGRSTTIYLTVGEDSEWIVYPLPLAGGQHRNTAVNRILRAFLYGDDLTLVE